MTRQVQCPKCGMYHVTTQIVTARRADKKNIAKPTFGEGCLGCIGLYFFAPLFLLFVILFTPLLSQFVELFSRINWNDDPNKSIIQFVISLSSLELSNDPNILLMLLCIGPLAIAATLKSLSGPVRHIAYTLTSKGELHRHRCSHCGFKWSRWRDESPPKIRRSAPPSGEPSSQVEDSDKMRLEFLDIHSDLDQRLRQHIARKYGYNETDLEEMNFPQVVNVLEKKEPSIFDTYVARRLMTFNSTRNQIAHKKQTVTKTDLANFKELAMKLERSLKR